MQTSSPSSATGSCRSTTDAKQICHEYKVGDLVWKKQYIGLSDKLLDTVLGPYPITTIHTNGTVTIKLTPVTTERIKIRRGLPKQSVPR